MLIGRNVLGLFITLLAFASGFSRASLRRVQSRRNGMTTLRDTSDESGVMEAGGGKAIGGIAVLGALETGYLSYQKLMGGGVEGTLLCKGGAGSSCGDVLSGPYSMVPGLNVPLVAVALIGYLAVAFMSLTNSDEESKQQEITLFLTTAMATFSGYLMLVLQFVLHASCNYCYLSATFSTGMALLAWNNRLVRNPTKAAVVSLSSASIAALSSAFLFYATSLTINPGDAAQASTAPAWQAMQAAAQANQVKKDLNSQTAAAPSTARSAGSALREKGPFAPPAIKSHSSEQALAIGKRLQEKDAKMYGAYWCSHCNNQKQELGYEVVKEKQMFTYVECDKEGVDSQYGTCKAMKDKVPGYPTWEIDGQYFPGEKSLDELEKLLNAADAKKGPV
jgi:uncharacterized membrane protein